jgi:hypothetical protein
MEDLPNLQRLYTYALANDYSSIGESFLETTQVLVANILYITSAYETDHQGDSKIIPCFYPLIFVIYSEIITPLAGYTEKYQVFLRT